MGYQLLFDDIGQLPGGQSGNPLSRHYGDQMPLWLEGRGLTMAWSPEEVEGAAREVLRLEPRVLTS